MSFLLWYRNHDHMVDGIRYNILCLRVIRIRALDLLDYIQTFYNVPKEIILLWQLCIIGNADEELAAIGICTGICHGDTTNFVLSLDRFIFEGIARTIFIDSSSLRLGRITSLDDELGHDPVEDQAVIEALFCQEYKVVDGVWCKFRVEIHDN